MTSQNSDLARVVQLAYLFVSVEPILVSVGHLLPPWTNLQSGIAHQEKSVPAPASDVSFLQPLSLPSKNHEVANTALE
jgi:hypothetical protein